VLIVFYSISSYSLPTMSYGILHTNKLKNAAEAKDAAAHNYRQYEVANADPNAPHPSTEFVNISERDYWELAEERIKEVGITRMRPDAVKCVEILLTASPEWFKRDEEGRAADYSQSDWQKDNFEFLKEQYGEKNVLAYKLHQDEKSPHIHAIIVPITADGRLSGRDLFSPSSLRQLQTDYGLAMKPHGLERGVEHSQAKHQPMKRMYAQQNQTANELGEAVSYKPVDVIKYPSGRDLLNLKKWENTVNERVNTQVREQVEEANKRAERARQLALENAAAKDQVRVLQKQLNTLESIRQAGEAKANDLAMRLAGDEAPPDVWLTRGTALLDQAAQAVQTGREELTKLREKALRLEKEGDYGQVAELRYGVIPKQQKAQDATEQNLRGYKGGAERLDELNEKQAQAEAEKAARATELATQQAEKIRQVAEQERLERVAAAEEKDRQRKLAEAQARERELQTAELQRQKPIIREGERQQIERLSEQILRTNPHIYKLSYFVQAAEKMGIEVKKTEKGGLVLALVGSENQFPHTDIKPGGQEFKKVFDESVSANNKRFDREQEQEEKKQQTKSDDRVM
jgi:hypothetical protein